MKSNISENRTDRCGIIIRNFTLNGKIIPPEQVTLASGEAVAFFPSRGHTNVVRRDRIQEEIASFFPYTPALIAEVTDNVVGTSLVLEEQEKGTSILLNANLDQTYGTIATAGNVFEGILGRNKEEAEKIKKTARRNYN